MTNTLIGVRHLGFDNISDEMMMEQRSRQFFAEASNTNRLIAFVGAGISTAYGHPSWPEFARKVGGIARKLLKTIADDKLKSLFIYELNKINKKGRGYKKLKTADQYLFLLNEYQRLSEKAGVNNELRKCIAQIFIKNKHEIPQDDPLKAVIEQLGVTRFITTNYDHEIERAFERVLDCSIKSFDPIAKPINNEAELSDLLFTQPACSLTLNQHQLEALVQFAVSAPGYMRGVFHLHGDAYKGDDTLIVTEQDYQQMYLGDNPLHRSYREALNLAFSANPILFIGFSMDDTDLLTSLRQFVSEHRHGNPEKPLFALIGVDEKWSDKDKNEWRQYLYIRYGVKSMFYVDTGKDKTNNFINEISKLATFCHSWWNKWQEKPAIRLPRFHTIENEHNSAKTMVHHYVEKQHIEFQVEGNEQIKKIVKQNDNHQIIVLGRKGSGKGSLGQNLVEELMNDSDLKQENREFDKLFFATMHFTNDLLSTIDAAVAFFDPSDLTKEQTDGRDSIARLGHLLNTNRYLLVLGGIEKLLNPYPQDALMHSPSVISYHKFGTGDIRFRASEPINSEIYRLLETLLDPSSKSCVVMTSAVEPSLRYTAKYFMNKEIYHVDEIRRCDIDRFTGKSEFRKYNKDNVIGAIHHALRGHAYALSVIQEILSSKEINDDEKEKWLIELASSITAVDLSARTTIVIHKTLNFICKMLDGKTNLIGGKIRESHLLKEILQRTALYTTPITPLSIYICLPQSWREIISIDNVKNILDNLSKYRLLMQIKRSYASNYESRYTAHTVVRAYAIHLLSDISEEVLATELLPLIHFGLEHHNPRVVTPNIYKNITASFDQLLDCFECWDKDPGERVCRKQLLNCPKGGDLTHERRDVLRAAFGLIVSRWTGPVVADYQVHSNSYNDANLAYYDAYQKRLVRYLNSIRRIVAEQEWKSENKQYSEIVVEDGILYVDEIAWLYNELGTNAFLQGCLYESYRYYRIGQDLNALAERSTRGIRWCQSEINLGLVEIERGHLVRAQYHFDNAAKRGIDLKDDGIKCRALGHLGLYYHLAGNSDFAEKYYTEAVQIAGKMCNRRLSSIFRRHRGDLYRSHKNYSDAEVDIKNCIADAEGGRHYDLMYYGRIAEAHLYLEKDEHINALGILGAAMKYAQKYGIPKLEADACIIQARIALDQSELDLAARLLIKCLGLAASFGMGLRITAGLVLMGKLSAKRNNIEASTAFFHSAIELAERQGYQTQIEIAERELMAAK